jgi:acylphosphatase
MKDATRIVFVGRFEPLSFAEFVHHRAHRLALSAGIDTIGPDRVEVSVAGDAALVDAFEMACSLGPINCLVLDIFRAGAASTLAPSGDRRATAGMSS